MPDNKIQLIIEAYDKTKDAFSSLEKAIQNTKTSSLGATADMNKGLDSHGTKLEWLKQSWLALSAVAVAVWMAIQKAMEYVDLGAKALQAENAFKKTADSLDVNADQMLDTMKKASAGTIDESHLMQKALKGMAQDVDPNKIPQLFEAARVGAVKSGEDIINVADGLIDSIANQMPRGLRRFGLVTKDEFNAFNKAVASGAENLNLLDLVLNNAKIQAAKMGIETNNAAIAVQRFKAEVVALKEELGKGIIVALEKLWDILKVSAAGWLAMAAGMRAVQAAKLELSSNQAKNQYDLFGATATPDARNKMFADWQNKKYLADQAWSQQEALMSQARTMGRAGLKDLGMLPSGIPTPTIEGQAGSQAELDAEAAKAKADNEKLMAEWKKMGMSKSFIEAQRGLLQADVQGIKSGLETAKEGYKLQDAMAEEHYKDGLDAESIYIAEKQRLEKAGLTDTLDALEKEKKATQIRYSAMIGAVLPNESNDEERNKLAAERKKEMLRLDGEIAKARIDLSIAEKKNDIDAIERRQKMADVTREGELSLLQQLVTLRTQLNILQVERGGMTESAATAAELAGNRSILELQRQQTEEKIVAGGLTDDEDAKLKNQLSLLDDLLGSEKFATAEKLKQQQSDEKTLDTDRERLVNTYKLREELAKSTGDYQTMYDMQKRSLEIERARALLKVEKTSGYTQEDIDAVNKYYDNLASRIAAMKTPLGSITLALKDVAAEAKDTGQKLYDSFKKAFDGLADTLTDFVMTGKDSFADLARSIIRDLIKIQIQASITGPLSGGLSSLLGSLLGGSPAAGGGSSQTTIGSSGFASYTPFTAQGSHSGGMGDEPSFFRIVPNLDRLPRYHKGLGPGERLSITTDDEMTLTPGQQKRFYELAQKVAPGGDNISVNVPVSVSAREGGKKWTSEFKNELEAAVVSIVRKYANG
jgi:lambda family phage tail tape measure protein